MAYKICQNQLKLLPKIINDPLKWPNFYNIVTKWEKFVKSGLTVWDAKAQNESKSTATRYYDYQYHILTYLLACIKSPMGIFAHEQCDQMLECYKENRVTKFSKSSPKSCHSSFLKKGWFSKQPKTLSHIWDIFARKFVAKIFNFFSKFGHPAVSHGRHEATILLYNLYSSSSFSSLCCCWKRITIMFC